jgi:predicted CopG family antitoxin
MSKVRTTLMIDGRLVRAVRAKAARTGRPESEVIENAIRRDFGFDLLNRQQATLSEEEAMKLALEAQLEARRDRA